MLSPVRIPRLQGNRSISDGQGLPDTGFLRTVNDALDQIELAINSIIDNADAVAAAQAAADAAQDAAISAAAQAAVSALAAANAQTTADGNLNPATAATLFVNQDITPAWNLATGTSDRSTFATYTSAVISNPPTQAEVQAIADATQAASQHLKSLIGDLIGNNTLTS